MSNGELLGGLVENAPSEGYVVLRVDSDACPSQLADDLRGIEVARWLSVTLREDFETACYGSRVYGSLGTFDGVIAEEMPHHWRRTDVRVGHVPVWTPDSRHPLGKWFADAAARLLSLPPPEVLDAILRRHGIEGSKEPLPQMFQIEGGWAVLIHKPRSKWTEVAGIARDDGLLSLWMSPGALDARGA